MLALMKALSGHRRDDARPDDAGVGLVLVVVLMFLGLIIATSIAAMVMFSIHTNADNKHNTQAYVAAESGRDAAVAAIHANIAAGDGALTCSTGFTAPAVDTPDFGYTATVRWAADDTDPSEWSSVVSGASEYDACPTDSSQYVVISATGTSNGQTSTVDSVFPWTKSPDTRPAGTLAYFDSEFKATKSTYTGDLVIRGTSNYSCNNSTGPVVEGDLWVTNAGIDVTGPCEVTGNIYAYGTVDVANKDFKVGGDVITQHGDINITAKDATVGGQIYSGGNVSLTKNGVVGHIETSATLCTAAGFPTAPCKIGWVVKAVGTVTSPFPTVWTHPDGTVASGADHQAAPVIDPPLSAVHDATAWLELDSSLDWGTGDVQRVTGACTQSQLQNALQATGPQPRVFIDMTGCGGTVNPGNVNVKRDALIYVPSSDSMDLNLGGTISKTGDPQLIVVHGDANRADHQPTCTTGSDKLTVATTIAPRTMIYSPCGINNTMALTMTGQLYMGTQGLHLNGGTFSCSPMGWAPAFKNLSCGVKGSGGIFDPSRTVVSIGQLTYQVEDAPRP